MRWLFLFVLFLNFAYIAWQVSMPAADTSYSNIKPIKNTQTIVLLSELKHQSASATQQNEVDESQQAELKQDGSSQAGNERTATRKITARPGEYKHAAGSKHIDVAQANDKKGSDAVETASLTQKTLPKQSQENNGGCYTFGPFRDLDVLRRLTLELKPYVETVDFRGREEKEQPLYWVYIKPKKNRNAAMAVGESLKANRINDYYVIREGDNINGISLGYFRNKNGATGLVKRVRQLGFDVVLEPVFKTYTVYWLDYQLADDVKLPDSVFDKYINAVKKDRVRRLKRNCTE